MSAAPRVLVTDGRSIAAPAIIQSLAAQGVRITCGEEYRLCPGFFSRHVMKRLVYPSPTNHPGPFLETICAELRSRKYDLVVPIRDATTALLAQNQDRINELSKLIIAPANSVAAGRNKARTIKIAQQAGIACPSTYFPAEQDVADIAEAARFPVLVRPCESSGARGIVLVADPADLERTCAQLQESFGKLFIQEYIRTVEPRYLVHLLFDMMGDAVAGCVIRAERCHPAEIGPTAFGITVRDDRLISKAIQLLRAMNWRGPAEVEFLVDEADGEPKLMEVNPRFGNPVGLAIHAGADIPGLMYRIAGEERIEPAFDYKSGVVWRWLVPSDLLWLAGAVRRHESIKGFFRFLGPDIHYALFSLRDPGPALGGVLQGVKFLVQKERRAFMFKRGIDVARTTRENGTGE